MLTIRKNSSAWMPQITMTAASGFITAPFDIGFSEEDNP
jgi:hypothetical protein